DSMCSRTTASRRSRRVVVVALVIALLLLVQAILALAFARTSRQWYRNGAPRGERSERRADPVLERHRRRQVDCLAAGAGRAAGCTRPSRYGCHPRRAP